MDAGKPDPEVAPTPAHSLWQRLAAAAHGAGAVPGDRRVALAVAALLALGPVLTIGGASLLAARERAATARLQAELAPRLAAERAAAEARAELGRAAARPPLGTTLDALARVLPADAALMRAERTRDGALELDISSTDPDALRAAIRRAPEFARLRDTSQRRADAAMIVSLRGEPE